MMKAAMIFLVLGACGAGQANAAVLFEKDVIKTTAGNLYITFIGLGFTPLAQVTVYLCDLGGATLADHVTASSTAYYQCPRLRDNSSAGHK